MGLVHAAVEPGSTAYWVYWVVGIYAAGVFLTAMYNFEAAEHRTRSRGYLEVSTVLMAAGVGILGVWRLGVSESLLLPRLAGPLLLASQVIVLKVVYDALDSLKEVRG